MSKTRNAKLPDHRYFDVRRFAAEEQEDLDDDEDAGAAASAEGLQYAQYVQAYAKYVFFRTKTFSSK